MPQAPTNTPIPPSSPGNDTRFAGAIPALYDEVLVPMMFAPYAADMARRVAARRPRRVLEIAAGTGAVTRALAAALGGDAEIVATDLNAAMLDQAAGRGTPPGVQWRSADAMDLPFDAAQFDVVVCQFGAMFFPDRPHAYAQARRVLAPGGAFLFNVWDEIATNEFADTVNTALAGLFPHDPPRFMARVPHGHGDRALIRRDLAAAGFAAEPQIDSVAARTHAPSAQVAATGYCQGTPLRGEIEQRAPGGLARATEVCAEALAQRFGNGAIAGWAQAFVITVE